ncbi:glycoside hydrolase family 24 protein [Tenacibaculum maritimum]|uniref:Peptidoglycan lytic transglycosylase, family GH104 n=1 Tax=Tenacibaculum maritimum NCIMB 2154 TaxID=1349785 RepID=A0A2H1EAE8_9FLAO|nr:glycoside hydrolase family 104 protein [Tenacibaculum maritimum]SFZ83217.1 Peptidoglycan lytic transglycosylase, family GH104 [Tenacibaculum maritimum NCIMB 2154]
MEERIVLVSFFLLFIVKKKQVAPATRACSKQEKQPVRKFPNTDMVYHFHPIGFVNQMRLMFPQGNGECKCEARVRAFLRVIQWAEGTEKSGDLGYKTLYSHETFNDYSTHPDNKITAGKYTSSAAGAYQIMGFTHKRLSGYKLIKKKNLKGQTYYVASDDYKESRDLIKKYNIPDFSPESQDKLAVIILKHYRKGILDLIIEDKEILKACKDYASNEWASLPPSQHGQGVKSRRDVAERYRKYYLEELEGKSPLYLKEGFLKELGITAKSNELYTGTSSLGKKAIDLREKVVFHEQGGGPSCNDTCRAILAQLGLKPEGGSSSPSPLRKKKGCYYQLAEENTSRDDFVYYEDKFKESIVFVDSELEKGNLIMVGVDHTFKYRKFGKINEDTTDHYVLIIGRSILEGEIVYNYWDVGTYNGGKGDYYFSVESNRFVSNSRGKRYIMTQVRKNYKI